MWGLDLALVLTLALPATMPPAQPLRPLPVYPGASQSSSPRRTTGWTLLGSGAVLSIVGGAFAGQASGVEDDARRTNDLTRYQELHDRSRDFTIAGWTLLGAGAVAVTAGIVLVALPERSHRTALRVRTSGAGAVFSW